MSDASTDTGVYASDAPQGDLWRLARSWLEDAGHIYRRMLPGGIGRVPALRLMRWLYLIEGLVRRLILTLAAAMTLKPAKRGPKTGKPARAIPQPAESAPAFRLFTVHKPRKPIRPRILSFDQLPERRPIALPRRGPRLPVLAADPLLRIGAMRKKRKRPKSLTRYGPILRHPREPAPRLGGARDEEEYWMAPVGAPPPPWRMPKRPRAAPSGNPVSVTVVPGHATLAAPALMRRLDALARVLADPARFIRRAARQLAADGLLNKLQCASVPRLRSPPAIPAQGPETLTRSHKIFLAARRPDTS